MHVSPEPGRGILRNPDQGHYKLWWQPAYHLWSGNHQCWWWIWPPARGIPSSCRRDLQVYVLHLAGRDPRVLTRHTEHYLREYNYIADLCGLLSSWFRHKTKVHTRTHKKKRPRVKMFSPNFGVMGGCSEWKITFYFSVSEDIMI